ncbi:MAG: hypothetical protein HY924_05025 [Elusimicrobia bacterium]|nr:hypothetical protein [Elusimicrobiota bacterium]
MNEAAKKFSALLLLLPSLAMAQALPAVKDTEGLFLDMSKVNLGTITSDEDKQRYIYTIQLEKARITRKTLKGVYENAFDLYRKGEFDAAKELAGRIIAIDPGYEDAAILRRASDELHGSQKPRFSEKKLIESKFEEGMALYRQGRLVEATGRWEEAVKLSPTNLKARYWLRKARKEMAEEHFRRGERAYRQHRLREALDQWYSALVLNPRYPRLSGLIARAEAETRDADANEKLQQALNLYSQGQTEDALRILDSILETGPGNTKAVKLMAEIRAEIAAQHITQGRQHYESRKFEKAIAEWKKAVTFGYDSRAADQLIARAKEAMRREETRKTREVELAKRREEEARKAEEEAKAREEEERRKAEAAAKAGKAYTPPASGPTAAAAPAAAGAPPSAGGTAGAGPAVGAISEDARRSSQQHYLSGVIYFQKGDYVKARDEWTLSLQLDPGNSDAKAGLERIEKLYGGK